MNLPRLFSAAGLCLGLALPSLKAGPIPQGKPSAYPDWWFERDLIPRLPASASKANPVWPTDYPPADDFAAANIGQLKAISIKAASAMDYAYPGGVPGGVSGMISAWNAPLPQSGLSGAYYSNVNLVAPASFVRRENIDFDWGSDAPASGFPADNFSIRWTGYLVPAVSGTYMFKTRSDDGVRVWVGAQNVITNWTTHATSSDESVPVQLVAGARYAVKVEYFDSGGGAVMQLQWKPPGSADFSAVPVAQLYSVDGYDYDQLLTYVPGPPRDDFAAITQGQLKYVAKLYYQRLAELGYHGAPLSAGQSYPWTSSTAADDDDFALVNLGQLKRVFSFSLSSVSAPNADGDGLSDAEETAFGTAASSAGDFDADGFADAVDAFPADPTKHTYTGTLSVTLLAPAGAIALP